VVFIQRKIEEVFGSYLSEKGTQSSGSTVGVAIPKSENVQIHTDKRADFILTDELWHEFLTSRALSNVVVRQLTKLAVLFRILI